MPSKRKVEAAEAVVSPSEDVSMVDNSSEVPAEDIEEEDTANPANVPEDVTRIRILGGSSDQAASYEFANEDHTLGNALRYIIMKNPDVEFCGYSIPHPSEALMNVRIQTYNGLAIEALEKGLVDLMDLCDVVADKFIEARQEFNGGEDADAMES